MALQYFQEVLVIIKLLGNIFFIIISETWTPTGENVDVEIRKPNEDLAI